jgi:hypothetical protein
MSTYTLSEMVFSSDVLSIITSHMCNGEDIIQLSMLSQTNKYIHNIVENDVGYIKEKDNYIDDCDFKNLIKSTEAYCKSTTFEEQVDRAKEMDNFLSRIRDIPSNRWCVERMDNIMCELYYEFCSMENDRWFHQTVRKYGIGHVYHIQYFVKTLYEILREISPDYVLSICDMTSYDCVHSTYMECIHLWLLEGEDLSV